MIATAAQVQETVTTTDPVVLITSLLAGGAALYVLVTAARNRYRATFGRRADRYGRLARLGTGAQLSFFASVLGEPPAMRQTIHKDDYVELVTPEDPKLESREHHVTKQFTVSTFIDRDYYVQAISDDDETVLAFSVTTRSKRFTPSFQVLRPPSPIERLRWRRQHGERYRPLVHIKLGRTAFAELDSHDPDYFAPPHFKIAIGAHNHVYSEFAYFGNPGHYQSFAWTASDAARQGRFGDGMAVRNEVGGDEWPDSGTPGQPEWPGMAETQRFRRETVITTYTVLSGRLWLRNYPLSRFGVHENDVRTLP